MKRLLFLSFFLFAFSATFFGQSAKPSIESRTRFSDLVIEGMVIFQESFLNPTDGRIYTSFLVEVDKVFKGSIIGDKIEIITLGGRVGNRAGIVSDAPKFNLGQRGIFFARTMDQLRSVNQTPNPSFKLTYKIGGFIALLDGKDNSKAVDVFSTYQSIRKDIYDKIILTAREPVRIRDTNTASPDNGARNPVAISFTFENVTLSNDLSKVTFDIYASCSQNGIKFGKSNIYIKYSPQVFGSSVASSGALTLSKGTIIQNTAYSFSKTDQTSDELEIEVSSTFISPNSLYELTTVPEQFCHLELDIQDFSALANIGFDAFQMIGQTWYYDVLSNTYVPFDRVDVESPIEGAMSGNPIGITFTFENAKITEDTAQYLELDVMAKAQSSGTEIQVIHLVLDYNTDAFGHSIYASNNVTVTHGDLLPTYNTTVVDAVDTEGSADNLGVTYTFSGFDFVELPTVPTLLCHLKMKVLNCEKKADVKFDVPTMLAFLPSAYVIDQVFQ